MNKKELRDFLKNNIIESDISYRGGTLKIDVTELFPEINNPIMGAFQNYLGGGIAGTIISASMFDPDELTTKKEKKLFDDILEETKKLFFEINNGGGDDYMQENYNSYKQNQKLPKSAY